MEPTSEQELKELLDEGKISRAEYEQLRKAMESRNRNGKQSNRLKGSRKQAMIAAILFTMVTALLLWICLMSIKNEALRIKSIVIGVNVVCVIGMGIMTLRYWIAYWTYKDSTS